jgi:hypothetical protein
MAMEGNGGIIASLPEAVQTVHDTAANAAANAANVAANAVATSQHDSSHNWWTTAGTHCHSNIIRSLILIAPTMLTRVNGVNERIAIWLGAAGALSIAGAYIWWTRRRRNHTRTTPRTRPKRWAISICFA